MVPENPAKSTQLSGRRIALTGARGFIGGRILRRLLDEDAQVTALLRSGHDAKALRSLGASVAVAPLRSGATLERALAGHDVLVHAAYDVRAGKDENLAAFAALLSAARAAGIGRIVHLSSAVVYDDWPGGQIDEGAPISTATGGAYRQAKIAMENSLLAGDIEAIILQPTIVYGPGSAIWTTAPMAALAAGGVVLPEPCGTCPAVYVDDVAQAVARAVELPDPGRRRFVISGSDPVDWQDFYRGYRDIVGGGQIVRQPAADMLVSVGAPQSDAAQVGPSAAARLSARLRALVGTRRFEAAVSAARGLRTARGPAWPDAHLLALQVASPQVSIALARRDLGYAPQFDFAAGLAEIRAAAG